MMDSIIKSSVREPFDPSSLKAEVKNSTIGSLVEMLKNELIDLNPEFQRSGDLWGDTRKSQLIESILLGLPLPSFYFYVDEKLKKWVVIDGLQRLCSLQSFIVDGTLRLQGLEFLDNEEYGKRFEEFEYFDQLAMKMHPVTLNVLTGNTSAEARYIIFQRVNSKGTPLTSAEMRNALFQGPATVLIKRMADNDWFKTLVSNQISTTRMKDREYVSRFLLFFLNGYEDYDGKLDSAINWTLDFINKNYDDERLNSVYDSFNRALFVCNCLLGDDAFRKPNDTTGGQRKNAVSLVVFEMLTVTIAKMSEEETNILMAHKREFQSLYFSMFSDATLQRYLTGGTSKVPAVKYRFEQMSNVINSSVVSNSHD